MEELKAVLARANLGQVALLTIPWTLLQVGGFWALADARAGIAGVIGIGIAAVASFLILAFVYHRNQIKLANLILLRSGGIESEFYGFFSLFRFWSARLELVRSRIPGYVNALRVNYIALPLAFLAAILEFWGGALFLTLVWCVTGILVRSAVVRAVTGESTAVSGRVRWGIVLLFVVSAVGWAYVRYEAASAEEIYREKVAQLQKESFLLTGAELAAHYELKGENGADAVRALTHFPEIPDSLRRLAAPVWVTDVSPDAYGELEKFVFENRAFLDQLAKIARNRSARLGFEFEKGIDGRGGEELSARYRMLEEMERLGFYSYAAVGNSRRVEESWNVLGALRRQLSGEPLLAGSAVVMEMESRRLDALERLLNEFGIHSKKEADFFAGDLAVSEKELAENLRFALKGEVALHRISGQNPFPGWKLQGRGSRSLARFFPALDWIRSGSSAVYLEGMSRFEAAVGEPEKYAGIRSSLAGLPVGLTPGVSALHAADAVVARYRGLVRRMRAGGVALWLDRYRQAHGAFPDTLAELKKEFPVAVCTDPLSGETLKYEKKKFSVEATEPVSGVTRLRWTDGAVIGGDAGFRIIR